MGKWQIRWKTFFFKTNSGPGCKSKVSIKSSHIMIYTWEVVIWIMVSKMQWVMENLFEPFKGMHDFQDTDVFKRRPQTLPFSEMLLFWSKDWNQDVNIVNSCEYQLKTRLFSISIILFVCKTWGDKNVKDWVNFIYIQCSDIRKSVTVQEMRLKLTWKLRCYKLDFLCCFVIHMTSLNAFPS